MMTENTENTETGEIPGEGEGIEEKTLDRKDITYDILIDDLLEDEGRGLGGPAEPPASSAAEKGDHPAITVLDMAVKQSGAYLRKQGLPPANNDVYESFSKPFLNEALWHYLPEGTLPDDPRFALVMGVAGLGLAFSPTLIALYHKREEEEKRRIAEERKKRRKREENDEGEMEEKPERRIPVPRSEVSKEPVPEPPWMERLEGGALLGI